jgi:hypothetical protein
MGSILFYAVDLFSLKKIKAIGMGRVGRHSKMNKIQQLFL